MASTFGVTPATVRSHFFPHQDTFSADTVPTESTVTEIIAEKAAELAGHLQVEGIDGSSLTEDSDAYRWCRSTLREMVAIRVVAAGIAADPQVLDDWKTHVARQLDYLDEYGRAALGGGTSNPTVEPNGPTTHLDVLGISSPTVVTTAPDILRSSDDF